MASYNTEELLCVKCREPSSKGNVFSKVGAPKRKRKGICENDPPEKLTEQSEELKLKELTMCQKFEHEMEVYTLTEFHEAISKLGNEVYSLKMTKEKLKEKYGASIPFVQRGNRSNIILYENIRFSHLFF